MELSLALNKWLKKACYVNKDLLDIARFNCRFLSFPAFAEFNPMSDILGEDNSWIDAWREGRVTLFGIPHTDYLNRWTGSEYITWTMAVMDYETIKNILDESGNLAKHPYHDLIEHEDLVDACWFTQRYRMPFTMGSEYFGKFIGQFPRQRTPKYPKVDLVDTDFSDIILERKGVSPGNAGYAYTFYGVLEFDAIGYLPAYHENWEMYWDGTEWKWIWPSSDRNINTKYRYAQTMSYSSLNSRGKALEAMMQMMYGVLDILESPGGAIIDDDVIDNWSDTIDFEHFIVKFQDLTTPEKLILFQDETRCKNPDGKYYLTHPGLGTDVLSIGVVVAGLAIAFKPIMKLVFGTGKKLRTMKKTKKRHNSILSGININERLVTQVLRENQKSLKMLQEGKVTKSDVRDITKILNDLIEAITFKFLRP